MSAPTFDERSTPAVVVATVPDPAHVFEQNGAYVVRVVRYLGVADREVMDVAQEVFLRALAKLDGWDATRGSLRTWLYGYCVHVVANHRRLRRHAREKLGRDLDATPSAAPDQEASLSRRESRARLLAALDTLTDDQRAVTVLHAIEELPMSEVTATLGIPLQTGYSRYEAARKALRRALEEGGSDD